MKVKNLDRNQTIKLIDELKKRINFNNDLNKFVRKYMKDNNLTKTFNGFHDAPTKEMVDILDKLLNEQDWMDEPLKSIYMSYCGEIFGQVYGPHVNSYVLRDLHSCERHLEEIELAANARREENELFRVERNLKHNRMDIHFFDIPEVEVRELLKKNGFRWSSYHGWTRQLTKNAEDSLDKIKKALKI